MVVQHSPVDVTMQDPLTFDPSLFLASRLEEKAAYAYNYVDLKNKEYQKKHTRQRHLGDVNGRYRQQKKPSTPSLVGSLVNLDFPESRAINLKTATSIINDQSSQIRNTFDKTQRATQLEEWAKPALPERPISPIISVERPKTAFEVGNAAKKGSIPPRPYTTGSFRAPSRKPPQPSGFLWAKMKRDGSMVKDVSFRKITDEIHDYWDREDKKERQKRRRAKNENIRRHQSFPGQWLSFSGGFQNGDDPTTGGGGMIEAFAGQSAKPDDFYNIDGRVGSAVVDQLSAGSKVHIGINGNLQSETLRVKSWKSDMERSETVEEQLKSYHMNDPSWDRAQNRPTSLIPLNWDEQVNSPNAKVLSPREPITPPPKEDLSERHPVVYSKMIKTNAKPKVHIKLDKFCVRHRSKPKRNIDGTESLNQRITVITVDQVANQNEDIDAMAMEEYEHLLQQKLASTSELDLQDGEEGGHPDLMQKLGQGTELLKTHPLVSVSHESVTSGVTVDKPPSPSTSRREQGTTPDRAFTPKRGLASDRGLSTPDPDKFEVQSNMSEVSVARSRSKPLAPVPRHASSVPSSARPVSRPRSEFTRRSQSSSNSVGSRRVMSSTSQRRYKFEEPVTPRTVQTPRSALAKPGHLNRNRVSSISSGPPEGEQEYIKISHQITSPLSRRSVLKTPQPKVSVDHFEEDLTKPPRSGSVSSRGSGVSISSLNVLRGDNDHIQSHEHTESCGCTTEAKRAMSAALSSLSHPATEHTQIINIPTARLSVADSDARTVSDLEQSDLPHSGSRVSFHPSVPEEDSDDNYSECNLADLEDDLENVDLGYEDDAQVDGDKVEDGVIINADDGLKLAGNVTSQEGGPRSAGKRSVTFQDELLTLTAPTTTPQSTPRGSVGVLSDNEDEDEVGKGEDGDNLIHNEDGAADEGKPTRDPVDAYGDQQDNNTMDEEPWNGDGCVNEHLLQESHEVDGSHSGVGTGANVAQERFHEGETRPSSASKELHDLREKIKADLRQTQEEVKEDLLNLKNVSESKTD